MQGQIGRSSLLSSLLKLLSKTQVEEEVRAADCRRDTTQGAPGGPWALNGGADDNNVYLHNSRGYSGVNTMEATLSI